MKNLCLLAAIYYTALVLTSCAAPSAPATLKSTPVEKQVPAEAASAQDASAPASSAAAKIGTPEQQAAVSACNAKGTFYSRALPAATACTTYPLLTKACVESSLKLGMSANQVASYDASMKDPQLAGFVIDQCLDCASPAGNALCAGTSQITASGYRLYFVKEATPGAISIKSMYFYN